MVVVCEVIQKSKKKGGGQGDFCYGSIGVNAIRGGFFFFCFLGGGLGKKERFPISYDPLYQILLAVASLGW